jgi:hypothetical protein
MRIERTFSSAHTGRMRKNADTAWREMVEKADAIVADSRAVAALFSPQRDAASIRDDLSLLGRVYDHDRNGWNGAQRSPAQPRINRKATRRCLRI